MQGAFFLGLSRLRTGIHPEIDIYTVNGVAALARAALTLVISPTLIIHMSVLTAGSGDFGLVRNSMINPGVRFCGL